MKSSILVLSGGLDSTVSAFIAKKESYPSIALFFDYGQMAVRPEREAAAMVAGRLNVPLRVVGLSWLSELGESALTNRSFEIPRVSEEDLGNPAKSSDSARAVWVPNRNGIFLNVAAAYAEALGAGLIVTGFNAEEAITFPDNSRAFVDAAKTFFYYATSNGVEVVSYTQNWDKTEIVRRGTSLDVPFEGLWSCYEKGPRMCGGCESCQRSIRAYKAAGIWDRMAYAFTSDK